MAVGGLGYTPGFVDESAEASLLAPVDAGPWLARAGAPSSPIRPPPPGCSAC